MKINGVPENIEGKIVGKYSEYSLHDMHTGLQCSIFIYGGYTLKRKCRYDDEISGTGPRSLSTAYGAASDEKFQCIISSKSISKSLIYMELRRCKKVISHII